jgi:hypothetical protein
MFLNLTYFLKSRIFDFIKHLGSLGNQAKQRHKVFNRSKQKQFKSVDIFTYFRLPQPKGNVRGI